MTTLFAQPYDISATGFYFTCAEEYAAKVATALNDYGHPVEEFEIQFIDGEDIDAALAEALGLNQVNFSRFLEIVEEWDEWEKLRVIIACGECGYTFDVDTASPDDFDVELYPDTSMREFAESCIEDGWFGPIPELLQHYIDYDAVARDLSMDYSETIIAGEHYIYRCA